jgi:hypothetical protein
VKIVQRTSRAFARVEPKIKKQSESVLNRKPVAIGAMDAAELNAELEKGYADVIAGRLHSLDDVVAEMNREYGI